MDKLQAICRSWQGPNLANSEGADWLPENFRVSNRQRVQFPNPWSPVFSSVSIINRQVLTKWTVQYLALRYTQMLPHRTLVYRSQLQAKRRKRHERALCRADVRMTN
jgi:hypothetical protein